MATTLTLYFLLPLALLAVPLTVTLATYVLRGRLSVATAVPQATKVPITPTTTLVGYMPTTTERRVLLAAQYRQETASALSGTWRMVQLRRELGR